MPARLHDSSGDGSPEWTFLSAMPKVELHVHVEGTIAPDLLFTMADRNGIDLPYSSPEDVAAYQGRQMSTGRENLQNFLDCLDISRGALRTQEDYYDITHGFLERCAAEGTIYTEMMFDPQQAIRQGVSLEECIEGLTQGRVDGERDFEVQSQLIMCFQRDHPPEQAHQILVQADSHRDKIAGVGLDNSETPGFPQLFEGVFASAREREYRLTSHCDVNQPDTVAHIRDCIEVLGVERLDHGLNAVDDPELLETVVDRRIALTGCPTFYVGHTECIPQRLGMHRQLLDAGAVISLNTDDPAQFASGFLTNTLVRTQQAGEFTNDEMVLFMQNAIDSTWLPDSKQADLSRQLTEYDSAHVA